MGVGIHFLNLVNGAPLATPFDLDLIQAAGFRNVRTDLLWREVEKTPGVYDFSKYDFILNQLKQRGLRPMLILGLGNPLYSPGLTPYPSSTREAFERYAMAAVDRYKGNGIIWEIVQQPNHSEFWQPRPNANDYISLVKSLLPKLRTLDPSGVFIAPSTAGTPLDFLEACFRQGLLELVDGVSIHPYQAFPFNKPPEAFETEARQAKALIDRYKPVGQEVPLLLGEWGYSTGQGELDEQTQANYAVRQALLGMMVGTPVNIWHNWKSDIYGNENPLEKEGNFSLVTNQMRLKPSYHALREAQNALAGLTFTRRLPSNSQDYLLLFSNPQRATLAAWTIGTPHLAPINGQPVPLTGKPAFIPLPGIPATI